MKERLKKILKKIIFKALRKKTLLKKVVLAKKWLYKYSISNQGIAVNSTDDQVPYPEVTGYFIPTILELGEKELATNYAKWLISIQNKDGSWNSPDAPTPYTFDTGQILKGLVSLLPYYPEFIGPIIKGCDWIIKQQKNSGQITTPDTSSWSLPNGSLVPEAIHLYCLSPIKEMAKKYNISEYDEAVKKALDYYKSDPNLIDFNTLSHFHAYILEALVDLGEKDLAKKGMEKVALLQQKNGLIPAYNNVKWVCSTGLIQYAVIWYKLGDADRADKAFDYACRLQNKSGGFFGSYGKGANYFPTAEIAWAVKYFFDAYMLKVKTEFNNTAHIFPDSVSNKDGRVKELLKAGNLDSKKILDAGCGKGRFLKNLQTIFPQAELYGIDISEKLLSCCPENIETKYGSALKIEYPDNYFDMVFSIEVIEHVIFIENAIRELVRVLKPGGTIIIIDKNKNKTGSLLSPEEWEQWFDPHQIQSLLKQNNVNSNFSFIACDEQTQPDGLFISWVGKKEGE